MNWKEKNKNGTSLESVRHVHKKKTHMKKNEDWWFQEDYRLQAAISKILKYYIWGFIKYNITYWVQRETEKDTNIRLPNTIYYTN